LVIHIFSPVSRKLPSGCRAARHFALSASDPEPDSLRQYAPHFSKKILEQLVCVYECVRSGFVLCSMPMIGGGLSFPEAASVRRHAMRIVEANQPFAIRIMQSE
jgi:hypothetical protein